MSTDQLLFEEHLKLPEYRQGEILGYWKKVEIKNESGELGPKWPLSLFSISVAPKGAKQVNEYHMILQLNNYNITAPGGCFWDIIRNVRLENNRWPNVTGPFASGFRIDWQNPNELYAPWDRGGISAHSEWLQNNKAVAWKSGESKIHNYLEIIHEILNSENYHGTREG